MDDQTAIQRENLLQGQDKLPPQSTDKREQHESHNDKY